MIKDIYDEIIDRHIIYKKELLINEIIQYNNWIIDKILSTDLDYYGHILKIAQDYFNIDLDNYQTVDYKFILVNTSDKFSNIIKVKK